MGKIVVIDSMCGRGKTQWALQNINAHPNEAVIYASPLLSELDRVIMVDRKLLKNPKGVYRKGTGTPRKQQAVRPQAAQGRGKGRAKVILTVVYHRQPNMERGLILCRQ